MGVKIATSRGAAQHVEQLECLTGIWLVWKVTKETHYKRTVHPYKGGEICAWLPEGSDGQRHHYDTTTPMWLIKGVSIKVTWWPRGSPSSATYVSSGTACLSDHDTQHPILKEVNSSTKKQQPSPSPNPCSHELRTYVRTPCVKIMSIHLVGALMGQ